MKRPITWWAMVATATIGLGLAGCGKSAVKDEAKAAESEEAAAEDTAPEAPAAPAAPAAPVKPPVAAADKSGAEELLAMGGGGAAPAQAAPAPAAPNAPPAGRPQGGQGSSMPIGGGGQQMPANYPRPNGNGMGGGGQGSSMPIGGGGPPPGQAGGGMAPSSGMAGSNAPGNSMPIGGGARPGQAGGGMMPSSGMAGSNAPGNSMPLGGGGSTEPGVAGGPGGAAGRSMPGMNPGAPGGGANNVVNDFTTETKGASSFLSAVQAKDPKRLSEALALHSRYEASGKHKDMFGRVLDEVGTSDDLDELSRAFAGMKLLGTGSRPGTGTVNIIVGKQDTKTATSRVLTLRHEAKGWKVQDYGGLLVKKFPQVRQRGNTPAGGAPAGGAVGGGGGGGGAAGVN